MKPKFKLEHFTEEEVVNAMTNNNREEACRKLGIIPNLKEKFKSLEMSIANIRLDALLEHFRLDKFM